MTILAEELGVPEEATAYIDESLTTIAKLSAYCEAIGLDFESFDIKDDVDTMRAKYEQFLETQYYVDILAALEDIDKQLDAALTVYGPDPLPDTAPKATAKNGSSGKDG
jgi:hypothetical protein